MKMAKRSGTVKSRLIRIWLVAGALVLCAPVALRAINSVTPSAGAVKQDAAAAPTTAWPRYSAGVADIAKMVDAKVETEVIKTYIKNSSTAYNPSATEIIALKDRGVGPEILTALLQRGAEVRGQSRRATGAVPSAVAPQTDAGVANSYAPAPVYDYGAQPVSYAYPSYAAPNPGYSYGWRHYGYSWPGFWLSASFGGYPYHGYGGYHYPYGYGGRGYGHYYGAGGYYGHGGHAVPFAGHSGGFHSFGNGGHAVSLPSHGGGFGGHASGRGR